MCNGAFKLRWRIAYQLWIVYPSLSIFTFRDMLGVQHFPVPGETIFCSKKKSRVPTWKLKGSFLKKDGVVWYRKCYVCSRNEKWCRLSSKILAPVACRALKPSNSHMMRKILTNNFLLSHASIFKKWSLYYLKKMEPYDHAYYINFWNFETCWRMQILFSYGLKNIHYLTLHIFTSSLKHVNFSCYVVYSIIQIVAPLAIFSSILLFSFIFFTFYFKLYWNEHYGQQPQRAENVRRSVWLFHL